MASLYFTPSLKASAPNAVTSEGLGRGLSHRNAGGHSSARNSHAGACGLHRPAGPGTAAGVGWGWGARVAAIGGGAEGPQVRGGDSGGGWLRRGAGLAGGSLQAL